MQTIFNVKTPFLNSDGAVIRAGRAWFTTLGTDSDCISITDADGTELANPLSIGSNGYFETQPFAPDGTDFHVIVQEYLGTASEYEDDDDNYSTVDEWDVIHPALDVSLEGCVTVDSLSDLAECQAFNSALDGYTGSTVLVLGYSSKGDFCPPRFFKWGAYAGDDANGNTIVNISSSTFGSTFTMGSWYLSFSLEQDIRWWGVDPSDSTTDWYSRISAGCSYAIDEDITTYFPPGEYMLSQSVTLGKVRTDGAKFTPYETATDNVRVTISNGEPVEDVSFGISDAGVVCYPIVYHTLRTSWLIYDPQLAFAASELVLLLPHNIFFDRIYGDGSTEEVSISHKHVIVKVNLAFPMTCEGCTVEFVSNGSSVPKLTATTKPAYKFTDCSLSGDVTCDGIVALTNCGTLPIGFFSDDPTNYKKMLYASSGTTFYVAEDVDLSGDDGYSETGAGFEFKYGVTLSCTDDEGLLLKNPAAYKHSWKNLGEGIKMPEGETAHRNWFDTAQHWLECGSCFFDGDGDTIEEGDESYVAEGSNVSNTFFDCHSYSVPTGTYIDCRFAIDLENGDSDTAENLVVNHVGGIAVVDGEVNGGLGDDYVVIHPAGIVTGGSITAGGTITGAHLARGSGDVFLMSSFDIYDCDSSSVGYEASSTLTVSGTEYRVFTFSTKNLSGYEENSMVTFFADVDGMLEQGSLGYYDNHVLCQVIYGEFKTDYETDAETQYCYIKTGCSVTFMYVKGGFGQSLTWVPITPTYTLSEAIGAF